MEAMKLFVYLTTVLTAVGCLMLLNEGMFDFYAGWNMLTLGIACYLIAKLSPTKLK